MTLAIMYGSALPKVKVSDPGQAEIYFLNYGRLLAEPTWRLIVRSENDRKAYIDNVNRFREPDILILLDCLL